MAMEGNYPENGRGLAMNGAEVVYRASMPAPFTENDVFEISNRARALENNMYIVAPNIGSYRLYPDSHLGIDAGGGRSMIVDYKGGIVGKQLDTNGSTFVAGVITARTVSGVASSVSSSTSQNTGRAPVGGIASALAQNVQDGTITSSPGPTPSARSAIVIASVPFATPTQSPAPR